MFFFIFFIHTYVSPALTRKVRAGFTLMESYSQDQTSPRGGDFISCPSVSDTPETKLVPCDIVSVCGSNDKSADEVCTFKPLQVDLTGVLKNLDISFVRQPYELPDNRPDTRIGLFCKNLILKDRSGRFFYLIVHEDKRLDFRLLKRVLTASRSVSLAPASSVLQLTGLSPGEISIFCYMNACNIPLYIAKSLIDSQQMLNFHPFCSHEAIALHYHDVEKFLSKFDVHYNVLENL